MDYLISTNHTKRYSHLSSREKGQVNEVITNGFRHMRPTSIHYGVVYEITTNHNRYFVCVPSANEENQEDAVDNMLIKQDINIDEIHHIRKLAVLQKEPLMPL